MCGAAKRKLVVVEEPQAARGSAGTAELFLWAPRSAVPRQELSPRRSGCSQAVQPGQVPWGCFTHLRSLLRPARLRARRHWAFQPAGKVVA